MDYAYVRDINDHTTGWNDPATNGPTSLTFGWALYRDFIVLQIWIHKRRPASSIHNGVVKNVRN